MSKQCETCTRLFEVTEALPGNTEVVFPPIKFTGCGSNKVWLGEAHSQGF